MDEGCVVLGVPKVFVVVFTEQHPLEIDWARQGLWGKERVATFIRIRRSSIFLRAVDSIPPMPQGINEFKHVYSVNFMK